MTMNAFDRFPARLHWNAQQLADAVPLRLHELPAFRADAGAVAPAANAPRRATVRAIVHLHGGSLDFGDAAPGLSVRIRLPAASG